MINEDIVQDCQEYINKAIEDLSDEDYMSVLYELAGSLNTQADAKQKELGK